jgi:hypothetical protein
LLVTSRLTFISNVLLVLLARVLPYNPPTNGVCLAPLCRTVLASFSHCCDSSKFDLSLATFARIAVAKNFTGRRMQRSDAHTAIIVDLAMSPSSTRRFSTPVSPARLYAVRQILICLKLRRVMTPKRERMLWVNCASSLTGSCCGG